MRHTACLLVDDPGAEPAFVAWLRDNAPHVTRISTNTGCGCCVLLYDLEIDDAAAAFPADLTCESSWTDGGELSGQTSTVDAVLTELENGVPPQPHAMPGDDELL